MSDLGWNENAIQPLKDFLIEKYTKSFIILVNGRIVMEEYFNGITPEDTWHWHSAGKSLVSTTVMSAQQDGLLSINDKVSEYLGVGWTSEPSEKENLITIRHLLTMTSGLDDQPQYVDDKSNLTYVADAGTRWAYSNVFQILMDIVAAASHREFESYFNEKVKNKIGMDGLWNYGPVYKIYHSTARSMARFGLLALNRGKWEGEQVLSENFFNECVNSSQAINPSYGYLWWLNGKTSYMIPGSQSVFQGFLVPDAPADVYAAMGAGDQRIYVVPGRKMVIVRMGDPSDPSNPSFALSGFDNALWVKLNDLIN
jgi:CubicO group peptidase (beta-lactamase class C family)